MNDLYLCPSCKTAYSIETARPESSMIMCPACKVPLLFGEITMDEWINKTSEEKSEQIAEIVEKNLISDMTISALGLKHLKKMDQNIATIKRVLVYFTVLSILGIIVGIILSLKL